MTILKSVLLIFAFHYGLAFADEGSNPYGLAESIRKDCLLYEAVPYSTHRLLEIVGMPVSINDPVSDPAAVYKFVKDKPWLSVQEKAFLARALSLRQISDVELASYQLKELQGEEEPHDFELEPGPEGNSELRGLSLVIANQPGLHHVLEDTVANLNKTAPNSRRAQLANRLLQWTNLHHAVEKLRHANDWSTLYESRNLQPKELAQASLERAQEILSRTDFGDVIQSFESGTPEKIDRAKRRIRDWSLGKIQALFWFWNIKKEKNKPASLENALFYLRDVPDPQFDKTLEELKEGNEEIVERIKRYRHANQIGLAGLKIAKENPSLLTDAKSLRLLTKMKDLEESPTPDLVETFLEAPQLAFKFAGADQLSRLPVRDQVRLTARHARDSQITIRMLHALSQNEDPQVDDYLRSLLEYELYLIPLQRGRVDFARGVALVLDERLQNGIKIPIEAPPPAAIGEGLPDFQREYAEKILQAKHLAPSAFVPQWLQHSDPRVRIAAAKQLNQLPFLSRIQIAAELATDPQPQIRIEAIRTLESNRRRLPDINRVLEALILRESRPEIRDLLQRILSH